MNRMKDIEDSFEDRYSKLKLVAIKLKKRVGEQAKTIDELEKKSGNEQESAAAKEKILTLTKNFTTVQVCASSIYVRARLAS